MKLKIFTEGGSNIGLGHISRCSVLYEEAVNRGVESEFFVYGNMGEIKLLEGYNVTNLNWMSAEFLESNIREDDYCIVDSYLATLDLYEIISKKSKGAMYIDDIGRLEYPRGIVLNPSASIEGINYPCIPGVEYIYGPEYVILRKPFLNAVRNEINSNVRQVLVTMGGADIKNLTPIIIKEICKKYTEINFEIVIGDAFTNVQEIENCKADNVHLHYNVTAETMKELMLQSDLAITAAGQTVYELIATKTPFIAVQIAENQKNNVEIIRRNSYCIKIIDARTDTYSIILQDFFDDYIRFTHKNVIINLVDDYINIGSQKIIDKLLIENTPVLTFKRADTNDVDLLYEWVNDEIVREASFNSSHIEYMEHKKWFEKKMNNNSDIYIVYKEKDAVGQIRIDIENDESIIDFSVNKSNRGKGIGTNILLLFENVIRNNPKMPKSMIGRVKNENVASQKSFLRAGYDRTEKKEFIEYKKEIYK